MATLGTLDKTAASFVLQVIQSPLTQLDAEQRLLLFLLTSSAARLNARIFEK